MHTECNDETTTPFITQNCNIKSIFLLIYDDLGATKDIHPEIFHNNYSIKHIFTQADQMQFCAGNGGAVVTLRFACDCNQVILQRKLHNWQWRPFSTF